MVYDDEDTPFSLTAYQEMDRVTAEWQALAAKADEIRDAPAGRLCTTPTTSSSTTR